MLQVSSSIPSNLDQIAGLAQKITGAQTVIAFLPHKTQDLSSESVVLEIQGKASSADVDLKHKSKPGSGLIGWVAKTQDKVRIVPFQHSTRALGFYPGSTEVKSIIAVPITVVHAEDSASGVLYCDSPEIDIFDDSTEEYLIQTAELMARIHNLEDKANTEVIENSNLQDFYLKLDALLKQLGPQSLEVLRIQLNNSATLEQEIGFQPTLLLIEKIQRLIRQAVPAQYPILHSPTGETLIAIDNMVSSFYENKIRIIASQLSPENLNLDYEFKRFVLKNSRVISSANFFESLIDKSVAKLSLRQQISKIINN